MYQHIVEDLTSYGFCVITLSSYPSYHIPFLGSNQEFPEEKSGEDLLKQIDVETINKANDLKFVIDQMKKGEVEGIANIADVNTIGVLGHSVGGAAASQAVRKGNGSIQAGVNMDGSLNREDDAEPIIQPFLHITSTDAFTSTEAEPEGSTEIIKRWEDFHKSSPNSQWLFLHNAKHMDFASSDLYVGRPESDTQNTVRKISTKHIAAFFQEHLKKAPPSELFNEKTIIKVIETYDHTQSEEATTQMLKNIKHKFSKL